MKKKLPSESWEQEQIFRWARANQIRYPELQLLNASLNGIKMSVGLSAKMKRQGMRKGYPDIFLPVPKNIYHGLFIELKKVKGGSTSEKQKEWLKKLMDLGYYAAVGNGHKETIQLISEYLEII